MKHLVAGIPWPNSDKQKEWLIICFYMSGLRKTRAFKKKPGGLRKRNGLRIECIEKRIVLWLRVIGRNLSRGSLKTKWVDGAVHFIYYLIFYTLHDRYSMKSMYLKVCFIILFLILLNF